MILVPKMPEKVQYLLDFSFPNLSVFLPRKPYIGGRIGYSKEVLLAWLLIKKVTNWDYRTIASMANMSHTTLVRANSIFLKRGIYEKLFVMLVKTAYKRGLIQGKYVAMDSSFVQTFSRKQEIGSENWNGFKKAYGFKLHCLVDCVTQLPIALIITNGVAADATLAIPLLKRARSWLRKVGYVLADKGYDSSDIVAYIAGELEAKAGIPIKQKNKLSKNKPHRYGNYEYWRLKAKGRTLKTSIYNRRSAVERVFSTIKRSYHLGKEETRGIVNFTKNVYLSLICYMLKSFWIAGIKHF